MFAGNQNFFWRLRKVWVLGLLGLAFLSLSGFSEFHWYILDPSTLQGRKNFIFLISGFRQTFVLAFWSIIFGTILGIMGALIRLSNNKIGQWIIQIYTEIFRIIPVFVIFLWIYYAFPIALQDMLKSVSLPPATLAWITQISPMSASVFTLSLMTGAFLTEIFRAGVQSIDQGQIESGLCTGMSKGQVMFYIVWPQALRRMLPPTINQYILTVKDTALASSIGLLELTRRATELQTQTYRPLEIYTFLALEYLLIIGIMTYFSRYIEKRIKVY